ncbi:30S ribosomal protein S1 [Beggiatoa sp. PS]|nr:30S ribosomal protein S1 [Beggiatoa sp. PS]
MLNSGDIVKGVVSRTEEWGLFLNYRGQEIFVQVTELDWIKIGCGPKKFTKIGNEHEIKILGYVEKKSQYYGSIKAAHPELNPWLRHNEFTVATEFESKVISVAEYGSFVEIIPGINGLILAEDGGCELKVGQVVKVTVIMADIERQRVRLKILSI